MDTLISQLVRPEGGGLRARVAPVSVGPVSPGTAPF